MENSNFLQPQLRLLLPLYTNIHCELSFKCCVVLWTAENILELVCVAHVGCTVVEDFHWHRHVLQHVISLCACVFGSKSRLLIRLLLKIIGVLLLVFLPVKQDPVVGGKPPRSPILSRRSYLSPIRGRRVGGHAFIQPCSDCNLVSVQEGNLQK